MADEDDGFFDRADEHILLSNRQIDDVSPGKVSASMMYATARFNIWLAATGFESGESLQAGREETLEYFVNQYREMLESHFDDYVEHFDQYMK